MIIFEKPVQLWQRMVHSELSICVVTHSPFWSELAVSKYDPVLEKLM